MSMWIDYELVHVDDSDDSDDSDNSDDSDASRGHRDYGASFRTIDMD